MKELSIKEKAKRYDEAIKVAKGNYETIVQMDNDCTFAKEGIVNTFHHIFPELKESEEESIKEWLINLVKGHIEWLEDRIREQLSNGQIYGGELNKAKNAIAWLGKQGEYDKIVEKAKSEKQRVLLTETNGNAGIDWDTRSLADTKMLLEYGLNFINKKLEKQGEQKTAEEYNITGIGSKNAQGKLGEMIKNLKPVNEVLEQKTADKVEPKFKVGDWVVYHRNDSSTEIMNVYDIRDNRYYFNDNIHFSWSVKECDEKCHFWTIEDAKDGDVLVTKVKEQPFIFKGLLDEFHPKHPVAYCGIDFMNEFMISAGVSWWTDVEVKPATKEQRDTLMKAMADAGYTFDFDKKVLKKIKQKPTDEEMKEVLRTEYEKGRADVIAEVQKLGWSEEDEKMISNIATYLNRYGNYILNKNEEKAAEIHKAADWIKSLKDKVYI